MESWHVLVPYLFNPKASLTRSALLGAKGPGDGGATKQGACQDRLRLQRDAGGGRRDQRQGQPHGEPHRSAQSGPLQGFTQCGGSVAFFCADPDPRILICFCFGADLDPWI